MQDIFEYDVFLSFASSDEQIVRPVWQELCLGGLRVFWSDATLKQSLGESWFSVIQASLVKSRHFVLIASSASMSSKWVEAEYQAFYSICYRPGSRRLIPLVVGEYKVSQLPAFLQTLQVDKLDNLKLSGFVTLLGGTDTAELKRALAEKEQSNRELGQKLRATASDLEVLRKSLAENQQLSNDLARKFEQKSSEFELLSKSIGEKQEANVELTRNLQATAVELDSLKKSSDEKEQANARPNAELQTATRDVSSLRGKIEELEKRLAKKALPPRAPAPTASGFAILKPVLYATAGCVVAFAVILAAVGYTGDAGVGVGLVFSAVTIALTGMLAWRVLIPDMNVRLLVGFSLVWTVATLSYVAFMQELYSGREYLVRNLLLLVLLGGFVGGLAVAILVVVGRSSSSEAIKVSLRDALSVVIGWGSAWVLAWTVGFLVFGEPGCTPDHIGENWCRGWIKTEFIEWIVRTRPLVFSGAIVSASLLGILSAGSLFWCFRHLSLGDIETSQ